MVMEEKLKRIDKEIEEKELDLAILYNEGYTDDSDEIKAIREEITEMYEGRQAIIIEEKLKEMDKEIEEKELDLAILYNEGYTDDSDEIKEIREELMEMYERRQQIAMPKQAKKEPDVKNEDKPEPNTKQEDQKSEPEAENSNPEPEPQEPSVDTGNMGKTADTKKDNISAEDIRGMIYDCEQEIRNMWQEVIARGDGASFQESERFDELNKRILELKEKLKMQENEEDKTKDAPEDIEETPKPEETQNDDKKEDKAEDENKKFQPPAVIEKPKFPQLDLNINKKTGVVSLVANGDKLNASITYMDADDYTRRGLRGWRRDIQSNEEVTEEDAIYLENVDPTIYNAYCEWDRKENAEEKYGKSAANMYVKAVIARAKNIENGQDLEEVEMPGKITADIGWHRGKDKRPEDVKCFKKLTSFLASFRANRILKGHDKKNMDLATVKSNRWKWLALGGTIAALLTGSGTALLSQGKHAVTDPTQNTETEYSNDRVTMPSTEDKAVTPQAPVQQDKTENENAQVYDASTVYNVQPQKQESARLLPGDIVNVKEGTKLYQSSTAETPAESTVKNNQAYGVNKISVVIDGEVFTTAKYSANELYEMADGNANALIRYHIDEAYNIDGKMVVRADVKNGLGFDLIYNDNGTTKTLNGEAWDRDIKTGAGWVIENTALTKANEAEVAEMAQQIKSQKDIQVQKQAPKATAPKTVQNQPTMPEPVQPAPSVATPEQPTTKNDTGKNSNLVDMAIRDNEPIEGNGLDRIRDMSDKDPAVEFIESRPKYSERDER